MKESNRNLRKLWARQQVTSRLFHHRGWRNLISSFIDVKVHDQAILDQIVSDFSAIAEPLNAWITGSPPTIVRPHRIYIPVFRSAARLYNPDGDLIDIDLFSATVRYNYNLEPSENLEIFTGSMLHSKLDRERKSNQAIRQRLRDFEQFLKVEFFAGKTTELTSLIDEADGHSRLAISIGEQADRRIHDVGDGIQAVIILMYRLFTAEPESWFFIEEPELNLHPGLQRIFLHALAHNDALKNKRLRIFMTTHSNHILGTLIPEVKDSVVYSFQEKDGLGEFLVRLVMDRDHNTMGLLGVANSSVYLANCSIWVEGITDRKYLQAYLNAYQASKEFKDEGKRVMREDIHFAFVEYAGSNLDHYLFESAGSDLPPNGDSQAPTIPEKISALAVCNRIFIIADKDSGKESTHKELEDVTLSSNGHLVYRTTEGIEIENIIPEDVLQEALPQLIERGDIEAVRRAMMRESEYLNERLGSYLHKVLGKACPKGMALGVKAGVPYYGTLPGHYKEKLPDIVASLVTWDKMSAPSRNLTKELYAFIERHNSQ